VTIIVCKSCTEILQSKNRFHFVQCKCPNKTFAEGGPGYSRAGGNDVTRVLRCTTLAEAKRVSQTLKLKSTLERANKKRDPGMSMSLIDTISVNVNNGKVSDAELRQFIGNSLPLTFAKD